MRSESSCSYGPRGGPPLPGRRTEAALFARYARAARELGAAQGTITLLVSHRFSTVRTAEVIVVLEDGRVVETGSHEQLIAAGGHYAELFALQARAYV